MGSSKYAAPKLPTNGDDRGQRGERSKVGNERSTRAPRQVFRQNFHYPKIGLFLVLTERYTTVRRVFLRGHRPGAAFGLLLSYRVGPDFSRRNRFHQGIIRRSISRRCTCGCLL